MSARFFGCSEPDCDGEHYARTRCKRHYEQMMYQTSPARRELRQRLAKKRHLEMYDPQEAREIHLRRKYGLTQTDYDRMVMEQGGRCLICQHEEKLFIDHDHGSGKVRGLLCSKCNMAIGLLRENPEAMVAAAEYIEARR